MAELWDGTAYIPLVTSIADIRSPVKSVTAFPYKIPAVLVARRAGSAFDITKGNLSTDVFLLAMDCNLGQTDFMWEKGGMERRELV